MEPEPALELVPEPLRGFFSGESLGGDPLSGSFLPQQVTVKPASSKVAMSKVRINNSSEVG